MKSSTIAHLAGLIGLLVATSTHAATLAEIYELSVENDPQIAAAEATYLSSRESIAQNRAQLLPTISANASWSETTLDDPIFQPNQDTGAFISVNKQTSTGWSASLSQPLFDAARWFRFKQSKSTEARARATFASDQQALIFRVADSYLSILEADDRLVSTKAEKEAVERQLDQVQQRFDVGLVAITDVLDATASFDNSTVSVIESEGAQVITFESLLRLTGQRYQEISALSDDFPIVHPEPRDEESWVQAALQGNLDLVVAQEQVKAAEQQLKISRSGHLPTLNASVSITQSESEFGEISNDSGNQRFGLNLNIPIFSGLATQSLTKQAGYQLVAAQQNLDLTRRNVVEQTRNLYSAINTDVARVKARLRNIESSKSALAANETGYEVGTRNIVEVLTAQQRVFLAQFQYAQARYQYIRDIMALKQIVGTLSPEDINQLDSYIIEDKIVARSIPGS